jgi:glycosyltransferase involved in cell wall biosynthesis
VKLLVFAHKPPPRHGQSYAVELLVNALGGDVRQHHGGSIEQQPIDCYHVDSRISADLQDVGRAGPGKVVRLIRYCFEAIWCRLRYGVKVFYYIPAPAMPAAIYRDWLVMALCRPFFRQRVYHWHAAGLGGWITQTQSWRARVTRRLIGKPDLSIVLSEFNRGDALAVGSRRVTVVQNGIPDPCPDFDASLRAARRARIEARARLMKGNGLTESQRTQHFEVLFIGLCIRSKGLFDALEAIVLANENLREFGITVRLNVAGAFWHEYEKKEFEERIRQPDLAQPEAAVLYHGFVSGNEKERLFRHVDALCFPTYYEAESFGLVLLEAMAYGLPVITTRWRMIPEVLPRDYPLLIDPRSPEQIAAALRTLLTSEEGLRLREWYLEHFTSAHFAKNMKAALLSVDTGGGKAFIPCA